MRKNLPYEEKLKIWSIKSLEERRTRGDLIQTYYWFYTRTTGFFDMIWI